MRSWGVPVSRVGAGRHASLLMGALLTLAMAPMPTLAALPTMAPAPTMEPGLLVHDAWTRATPMAVMVSAAFMVIDNTTTQDDALVGASSPAAGVVELHRSAMSEDGLMTMTPVESIPVAAGGSAVLEPGGYHLMLIGLAEPLEADTSIEVTLLFEHAPPRTVSALVKPVGPMDAGPMQAEESDPASSPTPHAS